MREIVVALAVACTAGVAAADTSAGGALFSRYCVSCHGETGSGDGVSARSIAVPPVDLTTLQSTNGGVFPAARIVRRIDGRDPLVAHGSPMPTYGAFLAGAPVTLADTDEGPMDMSLPVFEIVEWIRSLQK